jgi:hypothetical protein
MFGGRPLSFESGTMCSPAPLLGLRRGQQYRAIVPTLARVTSRYSEREQRVECFPQCADSGVMNVRAGTIRTTDQTSPHAGRLPDRAFRSEDESLGGSSGITSR